MSDLADKLERLCCAETEKQFFDCVTDNVSTITSALRALELQEAAEEAHANCQECDGEEIPELCPTCFPIYVSYIGGFFLLLDSPVARSETP
jgi:hypothetical protein